MKPSLLVTLFATVATVSISFAQMETDTNQFGSQATSSTSSDKYLELSGCNVQLMQDVELPALESGQIKKMGVKPGGAVSVGDILVRLDDERAQLALQESSMRYKLANDRATDMNEVNTAYKRYQLSYTEYAKSRKLSQSGSVSAHSANRAKYSMEVAQLEYQAANNTRKLAATEAAVERVRVQAANASINRHLIKSPIVGNIVEFVRDEGEWVNVGDTIMRLARMDRLRVPAIVNGSHYDQQEIADRPVTITLTLARGRQVEFSGKIVSTEIERNLGNKYRAWAEIDNRLFEGSDKHWMLQPGCVVDMKIHLQDPPLQSAAVGSKRQTRKN